VSAIARPSCARRTHSSILAREEDSQRQAQEDRERIAALGLILASAIFGFSLGALFAGAMVLLMAGYILYQTSIVLGTFLPTAHVAAALMLFSTVATLFWYVLQLLMSLRRQ